MSFANAESPFKWWEVPSAVAFTCVVQGVLVALFIFAAQSNANVNAAKEEGPKEIPIAVKPVLDELPLLKLGGKKRAKLPDMWKKQAPIPVKRFKEASAPSPQAEKTPEAIPTSDLVEPDAQAPPPDAEVVKEIDEQLTDASVDVDPTVEGDGSPDGVKEGTETDPLKARAVNLYRMKITAWFNARFRPPAGEIPCEELKKLSAGVTAMVGGDRTVASYSISSPSGNSIFDARVKATMDGTIGQQLPPPPPLYKDILGTAVYPRLSGAGAKCE